MTEHYYTKHPTSYLRFYELTPTLRGIKLKITTSSGVFSPKKIDKATKLLINNIKIKKDSEFLDLASGYGIIGVVAIKLGANVTMIEVNDRAVMLCKKNIKQNKVKATIINNDKIDINKNFDIITLNPPISAGMSVCKELITQSFNHLKKGGSFYMVARHKKGGSRLAEFSQDLFNNIKIIVKKGGFYLYLFIKQ